MEKPTLLRIMGLSAAEIRGEAYVLILGEANGGPRRIPILLGRPEAQAIAMVLERVTTERPTTHDLFVGFAQAFGVRLTRMEITRFIDGVYYSELTFSDENGERVVTMDSRTSDAIAIAIRTSTPIYASAEVMESAGFVLPGAKTSSEPDESIENDEENIEEPKPPRSANPENYTVEELERTLQRLIANEDYEEAEKINEILTRKKNSENK